MAALAAMPAAMVLRASLFVLSFIMGLYGPV
jgi:hypothetical protein